MGPGLSSWRRQDPDFFPASAAAFASAWACLAAAWASDCSRIIACSSSKRRRSARSASSPSQSWLSPVGLGLTIIPWPSLSVLLVMTRSLRQGPYPVWIRQAYALSTPHGSTSEGIYLRFGRSPGTAFTCGGFRGEYGLHPRPGRCESFIGGMCGDQRGLPVSLGIRAQEAGAWTDAVQTRQRVSDPRFAGVAIGVDAEKVVAQVLACGAGFNPA